MNKLGELLGVFLSLFVLFPLYAQGSLGLCGTEEGISPWLREFQGRIHNRPRTDDLLFLPIQIHFVGTDEGSGYFSRAGILDALCSINEDFLEANIQFFIPNEINHIDKSSYYEHTIEEGRKMMLRNNVDDMINCYIVKNPADNCGYFSQSRDAIALAKSCLKPNDRTWAHELGHYLSLPHPFHGWEAENHNYSFPAPNSWGDRLVERVDGSNCLVAGDGFCDTGPDYLNRRWNCSSDQTSETQQIDPSGETFFSDGTLIMSYSEEHCKYRFSEDQIAAMRANIEEQRSNLISDPPDEEDITIPPLNELPIINPLPAALVEFRTLSLSWDPIPNATHYLVQINPFNTFSAIEEEQIVKAPTATVTNLRENDTYYWRVRPFNIYNTCAPFTDSLSFTTASKLEDGDLFDISPNPSRADRLWVDIKLYNEQEGIIRIVDATGMVRQTTPIATGTNLLQLALPTHGLAPGMYFVQLLLEDRRIVRKVVIH